MLEPVKLPTGLRSTGLDPSQDKHARSVAGPTELVAALQTSKTGDDKPRKAEAAT